MFIAQLTESRKIGRVLKQNLGLREAIEQRKKMRGGLVFSDSGEINLSTDWLFDWELEPKRIKPSIKYYYARNAQLKEINLSDYILYLGFRNRPFQLS